MSNWTLYTASNLQVSQLHRAPPQAIAQLHNTSQAVVQHPAPSTASCVQTMQMEWQKAALVNVIAKGHLYHGCLATPFFREQASFTQLLLHPFWVGSLLVHLSPVCEHHSAPARTVLLRALTKCHSLGLCWFIIQAVYTQQDLHIG